LAKKKVEKPRREVTKGQLSRWQRQRKRQRIILSVGISIIVIALGIVVGGWFIQYQKLHQTVIRVNETEFNMDYFIKTLKIHSQSLPPEYRVPEYMLFVADGVVRLIEENELIRQGAAEVGIIVSDSEVDNELKRRDPPLSEDYRDSVRAEMLGRKLGDRYFEKEVPMSDEQRHIMAMLLESENQAIEVRANLESGEDFTELAGELSLENFSKKKEGDLDWRPKGILPIFLGSSFPEEQVFELEVGELSQPIYDEEKVKDVGYWLIEVLERKEDTDEAHVRAILLGSEKEAQEVRNKLEAGEDFATVSFEYTQAYEKGGDFGWLTPGRGSPAFDEFVFNTETELNMVSEPIRDEETTTEGGYWLLKVVDIDDNKEITDEDRDLLKAKAYNDWVSELWDNNEVDDSYLDDEKKLWAIERVLGS